MIKITLKHGQKGTIRIGSVLMMAALFTVLPDSGCLFGAESLVDSVEQWSPLSAGPVTTWTAPLCGQSRWVIQPFFFYNRTRGVFGSDGDYGSLPQGDKKYQLQEMFFTQYGLTEKLEIDAQVVYQQNDMKQGGASAHAAGFGDSYLFARYCAVHESKHIPEITGVLQLKMPTGKYEKTDADKLGADLMGNGSWDPGLGVNLSKKIKPWIFHASASYSIPQPVRIDEIKTRYADYVNYDAGAEYFLPRGFNLMFELNGQLQGDKREDGVKMADSNVRYLIISPGIGWSNEHVQALIAYQRVVAGTNTDANDSFVATFVYTF